MLVQGKVVPRLCALFQLARAMETGPEVKSAPKRPWFLFLDYLREQTKGEASKEIKGSKAFSMFASKTWLEMPDAEKQYFKDEYKRQMESFRSSKDWQAAKLRRQAKLCAKRKARVHQAVKATKVLAKKQVVLPDKRLKQPKSGFMMYLEHNRPAIRDKLGPNPNARDICKKASQDWKQLPEKVRKPWVQESQQQIAAWRAFKKSTEGQAALTALQAEKVRAKDAAKVEMIGREAWRAFNSKYYCQVRAKAGFVEHGNHSRHLSQRLAKPFLRLAQRAQRIKMPDQEKQYFRNVGQRVRAAGA